MSMSPEPAAPLICPRCRGSRSATDGRRCPRDQSFFVTQAALDAVGRDAYLGELIGGRYSIHERLGMGGMGAVYRGIDETCGQRVAVKFLREEYATHKAIRARFVREAEAGVSIDSPYIVGLLDFGVDADRTLYIVMECVDGWTLRDEVNNNGPFSVRHAREVARQLLLGLADAHDVGLIHRDLKHDNIMFNGTRESFVARILDFGVVKIDADDTREDGRVLTAAGAMVGSPSYMAPEQIRGLNVGPPADLYALAVVLYEAMTARRLFPVNNYESLLRSTARRDAPPLQTTGKGETVPPDFNRLLMRALEQDPKDRFPDARTMLLALDQMRMQPQSEGRSDVMDLLADSPGATSNARPPRAVLSVGPPVVAGPEDVVGGSTATEPLPQLTIASPPRALGSVDRPHTGRSGDVASTTAEPGTARATLAVWRRRLTAACAGQSSPSRLVGVYAASAVLAFVCTRVFTG